MITTNEKKLIMQSVQGKIHHPTSGVSPYRISSEGEPCILPATGGITYNVKIGDCVYGMEADHVEPGVSLKNPNDAENRALQLLACIGNSAVVVSGDAKGARGFVTGKHGGIDHLLIYFRQDDLERMSIDDSIRIKAFGQGLKIDGYEDIKVMNIDPDLLNNMGITEKDSKLVVPVAGIVPPFMMGSGIGSSNAYTGDYDIMTADKEELKKYGLDKLNFGDIVLLQDCDTTFGRGYLKGAVTIGVIVHSDCIKMGHGPGVTTIMTCKKPIIEGKIDENANIGTYIGL